MDENISLKILESYAEIEKMDNDINNKLLDFILSANDFVELSEDDYQIERTFKLNKISLKGYVIDSDCCINLKEKNISIYSINELRNFLTQYEKTFNVDCSNYFLALSLYESIEKIESLVDNKIVLELQILSELMPSIKDIKNLNQKEYEQLYFNLKKQLNECYESNKLDEKAYNICVQIMNDIFNYYISGYPTIPDEYLYNG